MTITRADADWRSINCWPKGGVPYDQGDLWSDSDGQVNDDGWRADCSGYLSMIWGEPKTGAGNWGGWSTVTFVTHGRLVPCPGGWDGLRKGDAIGHCGPGTAGNDGHIAYFVRWVGKARGVGARCVVRDQPGGGPGWKERTITIPANYQPWRYVGIVEDDGSGYEPGPVEIPTYELPVHELGSRMLSLGAYGTDVRDAQHLLNLAGASPRLAEDGEFGPATLGAVVAFQRGQGIDDDGVIGPITLGKLREAPPVADTIAARVAAGESEWLEQGDQGDAVWELQTRLGITPTGIFGPETDAALKAWQRTHGLEDDGVVGPATWGALAQATTYPPAPPAPADPQPETPTPSTVHAQLAAMAARIDQLEARLDAMATPGLVPHTHTYSVPFTVSGKANGATGPALPA